jgi:hypothetical protein
MKHMSFHGANNLRNRPLSYLKILEDETAEKFAFMTVPKPHIFNRDDSGNFFEQSFEKALGVTHSKAPTIANIVCSDNEDDRRLRAFLPFPRGMNSSQLSSVTPRHSSESYYVSYNSSFVVPVENNRNVVDPIAPAVDSCRYDSIPDDSSTEGSSAPAYFNSMPQPEGQIDIYGRRLRSQEKNRIAAMRSRQRKKKEWERLVKSELSLRQENVRLKEEMDNLQDELQKLRDFQGQ